MCDTWAVATANLPDGLVAVVKRECPTCVMVEPVLTVLAKSPGMTVISQDDAAFPEGLASVVDDTALDLSWQLDIETVPTLLRIKEGKESARIVGWDRTRWEDFT